MRQTDNKVTIQRLSNGLLMAHRHVPGSAVDYCGVVVHVGSRNDEPDLHGMAHFVEHTIFKGTQRRSSWHIINRMERVGGELNAYTTKEETVVYTAAPKGNASRALDLISDLVISSRFPDNELNKEREVVADEINSYLDTPSEAVFDDFEDLIFKGTPIGHNILGNVSAISRIDSEECRRYLHKWYTTTNMTFFYTGSSSVERIRCLAERLFAPLPIHEVEHRQLEADFKCPIFEETRHIDSHQAHTVMGTLIGGMYSPQRFAIALLTNILGGPGMNSLLNVQLREKRGLVYSVEAATAQMSDCGLFTVYFGCDPHDTERCKDLVRKQIAEIADDGLSDRLLMAAKKQYLGQLAVASDNKENLAISTGRGAMYYGNVLSPNQVQQVIDNITRDDIINIASQLSGLSSLTLT